MYAAGLDYEKLALPYLPQFAIAIAEQRSARVQISERLAVKGLDQARWRQQGEPLANEQLQRWLIGAQSAFVHYLFDCHGRDAIVGAEKRVAASGLDRLNVSRRTGRVAQPFARNQRLPLGP